MTSTDVGATLLWVDLEMTGLDPVEDRILEVAAIATDWSFAELGTYEAVQHVEPDRLRRRMVGEFWEKFAHVREALAAQNEGGTPAEEVEEGLLAFLDEHFPADSPVVLAGNSIHQDRKFIDREWPRLAKRLHYRMLDVSSWKLVMQGKYGVTHAKGEAHRALDDIRESIAELVDYTSYLQIPAAEVNFGGSGSSA